MSHVNQVAYSIPVSNFTHCPDEEGTEMAARRSTAWRVISFR